MGYYFDWINRRWVEKSQQRVQVDARLVHHHHLLKILLPEIERERGEIQLYASLLARVLVTNSAEPQREHFMELFGEKLANLTDPRPPRGLNSPAKGVK
jgi:hypothetical protein